MMGSFLCFVLWFMKIVVSLHRVNMKRYPSALVSEILFGC